MLITIDSPDFESVVVFLDGKPLKNFQAAEDGDNGWVEVIDPASMAPLDLSEEGAAAPVDEKLEFVEIKTIRKYGQVEIRQI